MATPRRLPAKDEAIKEQIYEMIQKRIQDLMRQKKNDRRVSRLTAKEIFDTTVDILFAGLLKEKGEGYFRLPLGYGIMRVKRFKPRPAKAMPTRDNLPVPPIARPEARFHLRYLEGATVKKALGTYKGKYERQGDRVPMALAPPRRAAK